MSQQFPTHYCVFLSSPVVSALEASCLLGGRGLEPFYALLEGGREGEFFSEMEEYFYHAQIRRFDNLSEYQHVLM